jgi:hypothetical protein
MLEEGLVKGRYLVQIVRLWGRNHRAHYEAARQRGVHMILAARIHRKDPEALIMQISGVVKAETGRFRICFDMGVFEAACAPGASAPSTKGLLSIRHAGGWIGWRRLHPWTLTGRTAELAATVAWAFRIGRGMAGMRSKSGIDAGPPFVS